jgi:hypothetical protein
MIDARVRLALALMAGWACAPATSACDSTGCQMVTRGANGLLPKGSWRVDLAFRATDDTALMNGSNEVTVVRRPKVDFENGVVRPAFHQDVGGHARFLQLDVGYGLTSRTSVVVSAPVLTHRAYEVGHPPALTETYATWGVGDTLVGARHSFLTSSSHSLVAGFGIELPTGPHKLVTPAALFDVGILDPMLQPGSGSIDFVANLQYSLHLSGSGLDLTAASMYQANTTNDIAYRYGNDAIASVTGARAITHYLRASLQLKSTYRTRSLFRGEPVSSTGATTVYVIPGLSTTLPARFSLYAFVPVPVYRYVRDDQIAPRTSIVVGVARTF